jgi:hypothetical protein
MNAVKRDVCPSVSYEARLAGETLCGVWANLMLKSNLNLLILKDN